MTDIKILLKVLATMHDQFQLFWNALGGGGGGGEGFATKEKIKPERAPQ